MSTNQPPMDNANSSGKFKRWFIDHPASVGESYFEHQKMAARYAVILGLASIAALIHAVVPVLCQSTARRIIGSLHKELTQRATSDDHQPGCR